MSRALHRQQLHRRTARMKSVAADFFGTVGLYKDGASIWMYQQLDDDRYWLVELVDSGTQEGGTNIMRLGRHRVGLASGVPMALDTGLLTSNSVWEYALRPQPAGTVVNHWIGNDHGYDQQDSIVYGVDGWTVTPSDGVALPGDVQITRQSHFTHADLGATNIADVQTTYTMDAAGLTVQYFIIWNVAGTMTFGYTHMFPLSSSAFDTGSNSADTVDVVLDADDGGFKSNVQSDEIYAWKSDGLYAARMVITSEANSMANWVYTGHATIPRYLAIEDRVGGALEKFYATRNDGDTPYETFTDSTVWTCEAVYTVEFYPGGADAALARA